VGEKGLYAQYRRLLCQLLEQNPLELWIGPGLRQLQACQRRFFRQNLEGFVLSRDSAVHRLEGVV
jgi:hypothetical protein